MPYREIQPTAALQPWVECFWTRDDAAVETRVLPDGCADLIFDLSEGEGVVVGTMTKPLIVPAAEASDLLGVRFRPGRAAAFLRIPLAELTDARVPLGELWKGGVAPTIPAIERELLRRLDPDRDARVDGAIARILESHGRVRIEELASEIGISRQHLARQFLHHVGVSPKTFARVMRFRRVIENVSPDVDWADVALEHGYYDQSHLIADFRELAGTTPHAFQFSNR